MSNVKLMKVEAKTYLRLVLTLLLIYYSKLLRGVVRVLLVCIKLVALMVALPLYAKHIYRTGIVKLATEVKKP